MMEYGVRAVTNLSFTFSLGTSNDWEIPDPRKRAKSTAKVAVIISSALSWRPRILRRRKLGHQSYVADDMTSESMLAEEVLVIAATSP
jgi:hypothetical protein